LMLIPLLQASLLYPWKTANEAYSETVEAEAAIFCATVLPAVAACDQNAAKTIADNVKVGQMGTCDFAAVKAAFESTYACMGIDPAMVGGIYDAASGDYIEGAGPMEGTMPPISKKKKSSKKNSTKQGKATKKNKKSSKS